MRSSGGDVHMNTSSQTLHINYAVKHNENYHEKRYKRFEEKILDLCGQVFSPMYHNIFSKYWNTSLDARMKRGYFVNNRSDGVYEVYIPTQASLDSNMQYYRVTIKVLREVDYDIVHAETKTLLAAKQVIPNGKVDSELFAFIAPRRSIRAQTTTPKTAKQKGNKCKRGKFLRGFRHVNKLGYLTGIFVNPIPERCIKRLLQLIATFFKTRIKRLLKKLGYDDPWQTDYKREEYFYYSFFSGIIESRNGIHIAATLRCFSHSYAWIREWFLRVLASIGRQTLVRKELNELDKVKMIFKALKMPISQEIRNKEAKLLVEAKSCYWVKPTLTTKEWQHYRPKVKRELNELEAACLRIDRSTDIDYAVIVREKRRGVNG